MRFAMAVAVALLVATPHATAAEYDPHVYMSATLDLATAFSDDGLPLVNVFRRGDSPFDNLRLTLYADAVIHPRISVFNQILIDPSSRAVLAGFLRSYVRMTALRSPGRDLHVEAGMLPTTFGTFGERAHSDRNPLVAPPLLYHYFTSLRATQVPANNAELLAHRGQGPSSLFTGYTGGGVGGFNGLPLIYEACWDVGVRAIGSLWRLEYVLGVTAGTLSDPRMSGGDNNGGKQVLGRLGLIIHPGLYAGLSAAVGPYLDESLRGPLGLQGRRVGGYNQEIVGLDATVSFGHLQLIAEAAYNRWGVPNIRDAAGREEKVACTGFYAEAKYAVRPGLYLAARFDRLTFGEIADGAGGRAPWEDGVRQIEAGLGYYLTDRVISKWLVQKTDKEGPLGFDTTFGATQLSISF